MGDARGPRPDVLRRLVAFDLVLSLTCGACAPAVLGMLDVFPGEQLPLTLLVVEAALTLALVSGLLWQRAELRALDRWLQDGRPQDGAEAAWRAALSLTAGSVRVHLPLAVLLCALPVGIYATAAFDLGARDAVLLEAAMLVSAVFPVMVVGLLTEDRLRPVVRDAAGKLRGDLPDLPVRLGLSLRVAATVPGATVMTAGLLAVLTAVASSRDLGDLGLFVTVGGAIGLLSSAAVVALVRGIVLPPVRALEAAARDVAAGRPMAPLPITSGDDLARLTQGFNDMVAAAAERDALRERAARLEVEAAARRRDAAAQLERRVDAERAGLARGLNTALAARLSRIGELVAEARKGAAHAAEIEAGARAALGELRAVVGVLRSSPASLRPAPGAGELADFLERVRATGATARHVAAYDGPLAPGLEVAAYRLVEDLVRTALDGGVLRDLAVDVEPTPGALAIVIGARADGGLDAAVDRVRRRVAALGGEATWETDDGWVRLRASLPAEVAT